jgi:glucose-6-phosphate 1-dehydrogenase
MTLASGKVRPANERLFLDAMRGDQTLFARADSLEAQWSFIEPIMRAAGTTLEVHPYEPGSSGPVRADDHFRQDSRSWRPLPIPGQP